MAQPDWQILRAGPGDAVELAAFHVMVWRETYRDMAPAAAVAALGPERRLPQWQAHLARPDGLALITRDRDGALSGLVSLILPATASGLLPDGPVSGRHPAPDTPPVGQITHLYTRADQRGRGLGAALLRQALARLRAAGAVQAELAVVAENHAARGFYARLQGREAGGFTDPGPLWKSQNIRVVWDLG